jgi:tetratricopeptide (TPR) repeat protein
LSLQLQDLENAEILLRRLVDVVPDEPRSQYRFAQLLLRRGHIEQALAAATRAYRLAPERRAIAELLAQLQHAVRQRGLAPADLPAVNIARATETGWPDAIEQQVQELRRDPYWRAAQADRLIRSGHVSEGLAELEQTVSDSNQDWVLQAQLARAYLQVKRLDEAEHLLNRSVEQFPQVADLLRLRGSLRLLRQQWNDAIKDYRRAFTLKPDDAGARADLGFCLQQVGDVAAARQEFTEALRLDPSLEAARIQLGRLLVQLHDYPAARETIECLLRTNPDHQQARDILESAKQAMEK